MTHIALEFVVSTLLAIALVAVLSIGAVYLTDNTSSPPIRRKPITPSPAAAELLELPNPDGRLSRVHLLLSGTK